MCVPFAERQSGKYQIADWDAVRRSLPSKHVPRVFSADHAEREPCRVKGGKGLRMHYHP